MLRNYLLVAIRLIRRNPGISAINIGGLAVAMTATLVIFQYVSYQFSFDKSFQDYERIYRMGSIWGWTDSKGTQYLHNPFSSEETVYLIKENFPEVEEVTWFYQKYETTKGQFLADKKIWVSKSLNDLSDPFKSTSFITADPGYFRMFDDGWIQSPPSGALEKPNQVVISKEIAKRIYGHTDVVGEFLYVNGSEAKQISGVYNPPRNVSLHYDFIFSTGQKSMKDMMLYSSFIKLKKGVDFVNFKRGLESRYPEFNEVVLKKFESVQATISPIIQPLENVHFSELSSEETLETVTYPRYVFYVLLVIGIVISAIAMANYFNLTGAQLLNRATEVSMRRIMGAGEWRLFLQHWMESFIVMILALFTALTLSQLVYPFFTQIGLGYDSVYFFTQPWAIFLLIGVLLCSSMMSAILQSLLLKNFTASSSLTSGNSNSQSRRNNFQRYLLGAQLICTIALAIGIGIFSKQVNYILDQDLGFQKEGLIALEGPRTTEDARNLTYFFNDVRSINGVVGVTASVELPGNHARVGDKFFYRPEKKNTYGIKTSGPVRSNFSEFYDLDVVNGRGFRQDYPADTNSIMLSVHAAHRLEFRSTEEALNKTVMMNFDNSRSIQDSSSHKTFRVIGVFEDYFVDPLHTIQEKTGLVLFINPDQQNNPFPLIQIRTEAGKNPNAVLSEVEPLFKRAFPGSIYDYSIVEETLASFYNQDELLRKVLIMFTGIAIILSCLGLIAMTSMLLIRKTKEIGIRKVLGASLSNLYVQFTKSYVILLVVCSVLAVPITWILAENWLNDYAVRIQLTWELFLIPTVLVFLLIFGLLFIQISRVTDANPSESLRCE